MVDSTVMQSGRYKAYPEYKNTFDKWVQRVPKDWEAVPLKYICANPVKDGPHETPTFIDEGIPFLSVDGIQNNKLVFEGCRFISTRDHEKYSRKCKPIFGDVLLGKAASVGKVAFVDTHIEFNVWSPLAVITPKKTAFGEFIFYAFQSSALQAQCDVYSNSNTQKNLGMNTIDNLILPAPSYEEQIKIANFLDYETAKIDTLIEKQQRLIELLTEKRQAVISHAVTKGLNPDVLMKDSGVEWLGEVPEHWEKVKLKHVVNNIIDAEHKTAPYFEDGKYLVCRTTNVRNGLLKLEGGKYTNEATYQEWIKRGKPESGDILFTREAPAGEACVYDGSIPLCLGQRMVLFKLKKDRVNPEFVLHSLYSGLADHFIKQLSQGSTVAHFNMADIKNIPLFEPSLQEQAKITGYLQNILDKYKTLINTAKSQIQLMQERRTALISAAVTGKIDVRDWEVPVASEVYS